MKNIYSSYSTIIASVTDAEYAAIVAWSHSVKDNIGMGDPLPAPEGCSVSYTHTYGSGSSQKFYRGSALGIMACE